MIIPVKNSLIEEIKHRISALEIEMGNVKNQSDDTEKLLYSILANEHSIYSDFLELINFFGDMVGYDEFLKSKYTPILDCKTKQPLKIGDLVDNGDDGYKRCGTLIFDEYRNNYIIKSETGGNIYTKTYRKIERLYDYNIDTNRVECRKDPNRKIRQWRGGR